LIYLHNMAITELILGAAGKVLDKVLPDPVQRAAAEAELKRLDNEGQFKELELRYRAIVSEAGSDDPFTSRARPSFMYVFYVVILAMVVVAPLVGVFFPGQMDLFFQNAAKGFSAIPEPLWWTFTAGYLGYSGFRTFEKKNR